MKTKLTVLTNVLTISFHVSEGEDGVFLVRESNSSPGDFVLSVLHQVRLVVFVIIVYLKLLLIVIIKLVIMVGTKISRFSMFPFNLKC